MSTNWSVRDGARIVTFDGVCLAEISSARSGVARWTDMALYLTNSGKYVMTKVGRSKVLHEPGCSAIKGKLNLFMDEFPDGDPERDGFEFHTCVGESYYMDNLLVEQTRYWVFIGDSAQALVDSLYRNSDGMRFIPRMNIMLIEEAMLKDNAIAEAYQVERI
jgi:hypothetical protein